jgi:hypothetical protein
VGKWTTIAMKGKGAAKGPVEKLTAADVAVYNKGRVTGTAPQEQRWYIITKKKIGGKKGKKITTFSPAYLGPPESRLVEGFNGVWDSEEGARSGIGDFFVVLEWLLGSARAKA